MTALSQEEPDWFAQAVAAPAEHHSFDHDGASLHLLRWNWRENADKPAVLLVHGYLAHAHWWSPIAPELARDFRVAALDLSGMGDSGTRRSYPSDWAARDILATIDYLGLTPATVVGHSYGGSRALLASAMRHGAIARAIVLDTYYHFVGEPPIGSPPPTGRKIYPSLPEAINRYRLVPSHTDVPDYVLRHMATRSIRPFDNGWTWKFDPDLSILEEDDGESILRRVDACVDYVRAESSDLVSAERALRIWQALPHKRLDGPLVFPGGHHHFLLEDPLRTARLLRALLHGEMLMEVP